MQSEAVLRYNAVNVLLKELGEVETERFIYLIKREEFDYTEWQQGLWANKTIEDVFTLAKKREADKRVADK